MDLNTFLNRHARPHIEVALQDTNDHDAAVEYTCTRLFDEFNDHDDPEQRELFRGFLVGRGVRPAIVEMVSEYEGGDDAQSA